MAAGSPKWSRGGGLELFEFTVYNVVVLSNALY